MRIINEQEPYARGIYCGSIGYFSQHGRFDTNIAIRTVTAKNDILHLAAGGGIVIDSDCEDEYRECYTKIAAIINGLKSIGINKTQVHSAVLVLHELATDSLVLTKRSNKLRHHPGEICFPGGIWENQDENLYATALRELNEELGIEAKQS